MKRRAAFFLILVCLSILASGCWSKKEISHLAIILAAGVDLEPDGMIRLSVQIARPEAFPGGGGGAVAATQLSAWVVSAVGSTVAEAQASLAALVPRRLYWGHCRLVVNGEGLARRGVTLASDFFGRDRQTQENMWVTVTEGRARDILESQSLIMKTSAQTVASLIESGVGLRVPMKELAVMLASKGIQPVVTRLVAEPLGVAEGTAGEARPKQVYASGAGVFRHDRLVGWLDHVQTRGLLWLKGRIVEDRMSVASPGEPDKKVTLRVKRASTRISPEYDGGLARFRVQIKVDADIEEQQSLENLVVAERLEALEGSAAAEIVQLCAGVLRAAQTEYGVDIFGFGDAFHKAYPKAWKSLQDRWDDEFSRAEVSISADVRIRRTGLTTTRLATYWD